MRHRTFPKDGMNKLRQTIQDLKAQIRELEAKNDFLERQLHNNIDQTSDKDAELMKKLKEGLEDDSKEKWRLDFLKRMGRL